MAEFDPTKVKFDPNNPHLHAVDCRCSFCQATLEAFDAAAQKFLKEAEKSKSNEPKKKRP